jgi:hypothetical protein
VKFSSPKNHAHPLGVPPVDASVNDTLRGTVPTLGLLLENPAIGAAAAARLGIIIKQRTTKNNFFNHDIVSPFFWLYIRDAIFAPVHYYEAYDCKFNDCSTSIFHTDIPHGTSKDTSLQ